MENKSGLRPLGHAVLVKPYEPEIKKSTIVIPETVRERTAMVETRAVVLDIGPEAWKGESVPRATVGDKVLISKFAGVIVKGTADGDTYRMVNDLDIYCKIEQEEENQA
ncbi:MAG: hypothetical protein SFV24_19130 [Gemmatimonadales bacterium]|nr:hypothetical protein [Gemmatimonadales bacterium]